MEASTGPRLRRSTRSAGKSPHFPLKGASETSSSRYFSSAAGVADGSANDREVAAAAKKSAGGTAKKTKKASSGKRKAKSISKMSNKRDKAKSAAKTTSNKKAKSSAVERTRSFEPAWWGNVLTSDETKLHPHATSSAAKSADGDTIYPPVHTLILGTHPSIASLGRNQMFGHDLNAFWYIAGDALGFRRSRAVSPKTGKPYVYFHEHLRHGEDEILEYPRQLERMVSRGFAMWDIVAECEREGSLDQDIKEDSANPIREFCEGELAGIGSEHLNVRRIVIANGTTGAKAFVKHFKDWFLDGKLCAAKDEMSQRVFKSAMNQAKKANGSKAEEDMSNTRLIEVVCLPGVSPAAAKFTYLEKRSAWDEGCYGPGLADYKEWEQSRREDNVAYKSPEVAKVPASPSKRSKRSTSKSVTPSPSKMPAIRILSSDLAGLAPENEWIDLEVPAQELRPSSTLTNGQCFNWMVVDTEPAVGAAASATSDSPQKASAWGTHDAKEWVGPLRNRVISIRESPTTTLVRVLHGPTEGVVEDLRSYFRLETPLAPLYEEWSAADARLEKIAQAIPGVRILRQDPVECMFSFICSSNNNIPRITKMLSSFRETYGSFMMEIPTHQDGEDNGSLRLYSFPTLESLAGATEEDLRGMGLGYRAKFIVETRNLLKEKENGGENFLLGLRAQGDAQRVQDELVKFSGIGRKVADCVALFSLDSDDAIPVDVHVQHIASRDYDPTVLGEAKSITPTIYKRVGDLFRDRFDSYPGWAHSLLFVAELPSFRGVLPADVVREMDEWRELEQSKKKEAKEKAKAKK